MPAVEEFKYVCPSANKIAGITVPIILTTNIGKTYSDFIFFKLEMRKGDNIIKAIISRNDDTSR